MKTFKQFKTELNEAREKPSKFDYNKLIELMSDPDKGIYPEAAKAAKTAEVDVQAMDASGHIRSKRYPYNIGRLERSMTMAKKFRIKLPVVKGSDIVFTDGGSGPLGDVVIGLMDDPQYPTFWITDKATFERAVGIK